MTRLNKLITLLVLGVSPAALAGPKIRADVQIHLNAPRGFIHFDDYDARYDRVDRVRPTYDISGTYSSPNGRVFLTQDGNRVTGSFDENGHSGMIKGRIRNGVLYFRWRDGDREGKGVWYIRDGRTRNIAGSWGYWNSQRDAGSWNLERVAVGRNDRYRDYNRGYDHNRGRDYRNRRY